MAVRPDPSASIKRGSCPETMMVGVSVTVPFCDVDLGEKALHGRIFELAGTFRPRLTRPESDRFLAEGHRQGLRCIGGRG